jgi:indolepyruvate ferredoxin oxidoreductase alpha subunit
MKHNGLNVAADFLFNLNLMGVSGGLLLVTCDDPSAHSSSSEQDTRGYAKMADLPLLEPATFQEAKEMAKWGFALSEELGRVCMMRGVTRISHARGNVKLGELVEMDVKPHFDKSNPRITGPFFEKHPAMHEGLARVEALFETSPFNQYVGPDDPEVLIITCGSGFLYSEEAVETLGLENMVGILKIGTTWPIPTQLILNHLRKTDKILFAEEVEPFLEGNIKELAAERVRDIGPKEFFGKKTRHIPIQGEINADRIVDALSQILSVPFDHMDPDYEAIARKAAEKRVPGRGLGFCAGCPHRASFWSIKNAIKLDDRNGFVTGDIGCYALGRGPSGFYMPRTGGAMGSGTGLANGFGQLQRFGFEQPVIAVCGDSTFFHAAMPPIVNARYNNSNLNMVVLDNSATAMTGFQPHPGVGENAMGETVSPLNIGEICKALGAKVETADPFDLKTAQEKILDMLEEPDGTKVLIMQRKCGLLSLREESPRFEMNVDPEKCLGDNCGCNRLCTRVFRCPGLIWNVESHKAEIDEVLCVGCGVCTDICPQNAILKEQTAQSEH